ncbi:MAG: hypothetical protein P1V97_27190 [Planctomycetota bacterium]|nr:hypothetical protein [Planctomycetota bacterium]
MKQRSHTCVIVVLILSSLLVACKKSVEVKGCSDCPSHTARINELEGDKKALVNKIAKLEGDKKSLKSNVSHESLIKTLKKALKMTDDLIESRENIATPEILNVNGISKLDKELSTLQSALDQVNAIKNIPQFAANLRNQNAAACATAADFFLERGKFSKMKALSRIKALRQAQALAALLRDEARERDYKARDKNAIESLNALKKCLEN